MIQKGMIQREGNHGWANLLYILNEKFLKEVLERQVRLHLETLGNRLRPNEAPPCKVIWPKGEIAL